MYSNDALFKNFRELYHDTLVDSVIPFWLRHGFDSRYGGIGNILDSEGNTLGSDKYLWSQGRALWTFSALCNRVENRPEWRRFADHIFQYLSTHGRDGNGYWMYRLDKDGNVLDADTSLYVDGFVMAGMTEYYTASGNSQALDIALQTYENVKSRLAVPGSYKTAPYVIPSGFKALGVAMVFSLFFFEHGQAAAREDIGHHGITLALEILKDFYVPEKDALLELVTLGGQYAETPASSACVPGHALEALWFMISIFERSGGQQHIHTCCRLIQRHLELGWDEEYGGLRLALNVNGDSRVAWERADCKPWWVQVEALVATAFAHLHCGESWCLEWHERIRLWSWERYPLPSGEWEQWFDREGRTPVNAVLPVKDPFHLPRALIYLEDLFGQVKCGSR